MRGVQLWNWAVVACAEIITALAGWQHRWISDDGLIAMRTVRQLLAGNGPVFNVGERVEANTSTLWTYLVTAVAWVFGSPAEVAMLLGLVCSVAAIALAVAGAVQLHGTARLCLPAGVIVILALPPFWEFTTSALETGLEFLWIGLSWWLLVRVAYEGTVLPAVFVFGLAPLIRPELTVVAVVFAGTLLLTRRPGWREALKWAAVALALPVAYEIFRMGYYGLLVPNPALAKEASGSRWARGLLYAGDTVRTYYLSIPLLALFPLAFAVARRRREAVLTVAPMVAGLLLLVYVLRVGGDFMHARMMLPVILLFLLPVLVLPWDALTACACGVVLVWGVFCAAQLRVPYTEQIGPDGIADERGYYVAYTHDPYPDSVDKFLRAKGDVSGITRSTGLFVLGSGPVPLRTDQPAHVAVAEGMLGGAGAAFPLDDLVIDRLGLSNALGGHMELGCNQRVGHEKPLPDTYILADYMAPGTRLQDTRLQSEVDRIRGELATDRFHDLFAATRAPMTLGRFWANILGAPERTSFRFPVPNVSCPL
ncbi:hypothetical protein J5X84_40525 [Streptosporangiaceae bacterium NEAU-GS5]|nr:hypothetical protein [Streptosporangiaceae bacterium NEAU-GS5]